MKKMIKIFKGAAIVIDGRSKVEVTTNTGKQIDEVPANAKNIKKYIKDKKYPKHDR